MDPFYFLSSSRFSSFSPPYHSHIRRLLLIASTHPRAPVHISPFIAKFLIIGMIFLVALAITMTLILRSDAYDPPSPELPRHHNSHTYTLRSRSRNRRLSRAMYLAILGRKRAERWSDEEVPRERKRRVGVRDMGNGVDERTPLLKGNRSRMMKHGLRIAQLEERRKRREMGWRQH
jgi:hypothetical protein